MHLGSFQGECPHPKAASRKPSVAPPRSGRRCALKGLARCARLVHRDGALEQQALGNSFIPTPLPCLFVEVSWSHFKEGGCDNRAVFFSGFLETTGALIVSDSQQKPCNRASWHCGAWLSSLQLQSFVRLLFDECRQPSPFSSQNHGSTASCARFTLSKALRESLDA